MVKSTRNLALALDQVQDLAAKRAVVILTRALMTTLATTPATMITRTRAAIWTALLLRRRICPACLPLKGLLMRRRSEKERKQRREDAERGSREKERKEREDKERLGKEGREKKLRGRKGKKRDASGKRRRKPSARKEKRRKRPHARPLLRRRESWKRNAELKKRGSARRNLKEKPKKSV